MYRVTEYFTDLQDGNHAYHAGDTFPRDGLTVTADRIKELSTGANRRGIALIEEVRGAEKSKDEKEEAAAKTVDEILERYGDESAPVENEPRKRTRKRKTEE